jgi:alpha-glucosidase (family GH31 glycosyl hydrolase)
MYHYVVSAHKGGTRLQRTLPGKYHYMFGDYLLVAPIYEDRPDNMVQLPEGKWYYWFDDRNMFEGPLEMEHTFPMDEFPVYVKEGAIIPMNISRDYSGFGTTDDEGYLTLMMYPGRDASSFTVYREKDEATQVGMKRNGKRLSLTLSGKKIPHVIRLKTENSPDKVTLDGDALELGVSFWFDGDKGQIFIKTVDYKVGNYDVWF